MQEYYELVLGLVRGEGFLRATFGGVKRWKGDAKWERAVVRGVTLRGQRRLQVTKFDGRKDFTSNHDFADAQAALQEVLEAGFANVHVTTEIEEVDVRLTKKGETLVGRKKRKATAEVQEHNRLKDVPLPEGRADHVLQVMGIMTAEGHIRPAMRAKFTQINEFLKLLEPVLRELKREGPLRILDCGCGASYLTIATHHYLNDVLKVPAEVLGVDVNEELIAKSVERTQGLGEGLDFKIGRIGAAEVDADVVLALHACDTATDDAIAQAVLSGAKVVIVVPCCHKDLNTKLEIAPMRAVQRHGILHQRLADITTDAFRAAVLRVMGYRAEVIEFISPEHTARNLMIRAVQVRKPGDAAALKEYEEFKQFCAVTPYLEGALGELLTKHLK